MCPNEKQHGPIRQAYLHQTNHKDVSNQVSSALLTQDLILCPFGAADHDFTPCQLAKLDQRRAVCELICSYIKHLDEEREAILDLSHLKEDKGELDDLPVAEHIYLGFLQESTTFNTMEQEKSSDLAFQKFHKKFVAFINTFANANEIPLPNGRTWFIPEGQDKVRFINTITQNLMILFFIRSKNVGTSKLTTSPLWTGN